MPEPVPEPPERDASPERRNEEEAMRADAHEDLDAARESVGLGDERRPEPPGAPRPAEPETGTPTPSDKRS